MFFDESIDGIFCPRQKPANFCHPAPVHNVQFVKYAVTVSFMAQVLDTVAYLVSQVLDTASSSNCLVRFYRVAI